jgi:signal transduction histidine kinase
MSERANQSQIEPPTVELLRYREQLKALRQRDAILEAVALAAERLMRTDDLEQGIIEVLAHLGQATEADGVYVFGTQADTAGALAIRPWHAWVAPGAEPQTDRLELSALTRTIFPSWVEKLRTDQTLHGPVRDFPTDEREILTAQNIQSIAVVPIFVEMVWWGFAGFACYHAEREWSPTEIGALKIAAGIIGAARQRWQAEEKLRNRAERLAALHNVGRTVGSTLDLDKVLRLTLEWACELFRAPMGAAYLVDLIADVALQRAVVGLSQAEAARTARLPLQNSLNGQVVITGRALFIERGLAGPPAGSVGKVEDNMGAEAATFVPLVIGEHVLGTLNLAFDYPRPFSDDERRLLTAIGQQVGMALANARLYQEVLTAEQETRRRAEQLAALHEIDQAINSSLEPAAVYACIVEQAVGLLECQVATLFLWEPASEEAIGVASFVDPAISLADASSQDVTSQRFDAGQDLITREMVDTRAPLAIADAERDRRVSPSWRKRLGIRALLALPLFSREQTTGFLYLIDQTGPRQWRQDEVTLAGQLASQAAIAIGNARLLDNLQRAYHELRQLDELKDQFIQNVAHELRTPLTLVRAPLELLMRGNLDPVDQQQAIHTAASHAERLVQLVEGITTLQDLTTKGPTTQPINLSELVETALQLANQKAIRSGTELKADYPPDLPAWSGDFVWLSQALYQLLDNAIKFSHRGSNITLRLRIDQDKDELQIEVEDQGIGISPDEQTRIFDLFYQVDGTASRRYAGTGMGLAIVQRVVQAHGGKVCAESPVKRDDAGLGPGSRFIIRLPRTTR